MKIAVNARFLCHDKPDGTGVYSYEILARICRMHPEHQFILFIDRPIPQGLVFGENVIPVALHPPARHPLLWLWWFEISLPGALERYNPDLYFSPDGFMSLRSEIPSVIVIHDINFMDRPADLPWVVRLYYQYFFPRFARKAKKICTVSEFSKTEICRSFRIPPSKISVHYNGIRNIFRPLDEVEKQKIRDRLTGGKPFFIFIGSLHPRKNLVNLLKAFDHFRFTSGSEFRLVITGRALFLNRNLRKVYRRMVYRDDVIFTADLPASEMAETLASAEALTMVSFYEGFGLPVVEAMMCDVPVIASDRTSIPEVAGEAAVYADPGDHLSISDAMVKLVSSRDLKENLIEKGRIRRQLFDWNKTASGVWDTIDKILKPDA